MKKRDIRFASIPSTEEVAAERERLAYQNRYQRVLRSTVYILVVVAAAAVLLATLFLPVLQVSGDSMNPTLQDKDIILLVKTGDMKTGDLCGFYWQNKLLLKRVIGLPGDVITLDEDGVVTVNGQTLDEPYVDELALGECDIKFPYQVPENRYFVSDLIGLSVIDDATGTVYGTVQDVFETGANNVYRIAGPAGEEYLFPAVDEMIARTDVDGGKLFVRPIPGIFRDEPETITAEGDGGDAD